jgi:hypothetical protein
MLSRLLKKWLLEAVQKVPEEPAYCTKLCRESGGRLRAICGRDARQAKLVPAEAGIQPNTEAYFPYVE